MDGALLKSASEALRAHGAIVRKRFKKFTIMFFWYFRNLRKVMIYLLTSCNTEERIAQNIYIHNSNRSIKKNQLQEQF